MRIYPFATLARLIDEFARSFLFVLRPVPLLAKSYLSSSRADPPHDRRGLVEAEVRRGAAGHDKMRADPPSDHNRRIRHNVHVVYLTVHPAVLRDHHEVYHERDRSGQTVAPADTLPLRHGCESVLRAHVRRPGCYPHGVRHGLHRDRQSLRAAGISRVRPIGESQGSVDERQHRPEFRSRPEEHRSGSRAPHQVSYTIHPFDALISRLNERCIVRWRLMSR